MNKRQRPTIETERLVLRPFVIDDASEVQRLAGDREIASTTLIPHPYEDGMAEKWIETNQEEFLLGENIWWAITHRKQGFLIGAISLTIVEKHEKGELVFWIGKPYWNNGYCTEGVQAVIRFGFEVMQLNKVFATHLPRNPASGRVMQKSGMKYERYLKQYIKKWRRQEDLVCYGILKNEYDKSK